MTGNPRRWTPEACSPSQFACGVLVNHGTGKVYPVGCGDEARVADCPPSFGETLAFARAVETDLGDVSVGCCSADLCNSIE